MLLCRAHSLKNLNARLKDCIAYAMQSFFFFAGGMDLKFSL